MVGSQKMSTPGSSPNRSPPRKQGGPVRLPPPKRTAARLLRTTLARFDDLPNVSVDLVADEADDDLTEPRLPLLKMLFANEKVTSLQLLSTVGTADDRLRFLVGVHNKPPCIVVMGPSPDIERASAAIQLARVAADNDERLMRILIAPVHLMEYGAFACSTLVTTSGAPAPSFGDDVIGSLDDYAAGRSSVPDLRGGRDLWNRGSPLYTMALGTAQRPDRAAFTGPDGVAAATLSALLDGLVRRHMHIHMHTRCAYACA